MAVREKCAKETIEKLNYKVLSVNRVCCLAVPIVAFLLSGCTETPNPVGAGLLPKTDLLDLDTTTTSASSSATISSVPSASTSRILVGTRENIESWGIIRFIPLPDSLKGVRVSGADLVLRSVYHYGDSLAGFSVALHQITADWSLDSLNYFAISTGGFYNPVPMRSLNLGSIGDTATITLALDTAVVRSWLDSVGDSVTTNHGFILRPTNSSVIKGFASFSAVDATYRPKLQVRYTREGSTRVDTVTINTGIERFVARYTTGVGGSDISLLYVRNGISTRGIVQFDVSSLSPKAAIHSAILELTLHKDLSRFNSYTVDSSYAFYVTDNGNVTSALYTLSEKALVNGFTVYRYEIGRFVRQWLHGALHHKVAIGGFDEPNSLDLFVLYGAGSPAALRPRLKIIYSIVK